MSGWARPAMIGGAGSERAVEADDLAAETLAGRRPSLPRLAGGTRPQLPDSRSHGVCAAGRLRRGPYPHPAGGRATGVRIGQGCTGAVGTLPPRLGGSVVAGEVD